MSIGLGGARPGEDGHGAAGLGKARHSFMINESQLTSAIRRALGREPDLTLWRNNVGVAVHRAPSGTHTTRYGLIPGASDLLGILAPGGRWVALEIKTERGRVTPEQRMFLGLVRSRGGFAAVVRSVDEARAALDRARNGESE